MPGLDPGNHRNENGGRRPAVFVLQAVHCSLVYALGLGYIRNLCVSHFHEAR